MKKILLLTGLICSSLIGNRTFAQQLHTLSFKSNTAMWEYFRYVPGKKIISGHRGTIENGLPENSIAAFEAVLKHTAAIFEIDPRYTKDSVAVLLHDATLDRTTNGTGKVSDHTWAELKKLKLRDHTGRVTQYRINTLQEVIEWAKGKTILNLDKKDLPPAKTAEIIRKNNAYGWVWVTVHNVEQAKYYLDQNATQYLSMHIKDQAALDKFKKSGLPYDRMIVYIGPEIIASNQAMYQFFNSKGVMCMISTAPSYDKLSTKEQRAERYRAVFADGASILESDLPIEVSKAIRND
ncbi:glycerophosphodiester phosphodiesterase family protein [Sphingobacterium sp. N143]|uniref:glycerophosphodiester phosphodiesterase family protein n=1 Tax=Sphingobacterium sp. N143 TaxID=2746727 RepID=UPI00257879C1|nr:glycerophosphodiester phosphodiesterase family protein [Sphingobacterium sp. N143]MDM1296262.1 glycerophosphodiester phosphodiesterase family protein [Sphingobacterium sp. N143]